jgi:hypothetical protein
MWRTVRKKFLIIFFGLVITFELLCGCQNTPIEENTYEYIFESDVVNLLNYSIDIKENKSGIKIKATIDGRIENIVDRNITVKIISEFYDKNDYLLGTGEYTIHGLRVKPKPGYSTTFTITYEEENVADIEYIKLIGTEI